MNDKEHEVYSVQDVAARLKVSVQWVTDHIKEGNIRARKFGRLWRIPGAEVSRIMDEGVGPAAERRSGIERRGGEERRSGNDRRQDSEEVAA